MQGVALPLFPLHTVLFPHMPLPLHIFEERYRRMIQRCIEEERRFGVIYGMEDDEVGPEAKLRKVGTQACIHAIELLQEDRVNILTVGAERFRILDFAAYTEPYMIGITEPVHDAPVNPITLAPLVAEISALFKDYFRYLLEQTGAEIPDYELPDNAEDLSFVIAAVLQVDMATRQVFLEMTDTAARLEMERNILEAEVSRLRAFGQESFRQLRTVATTGRRAAFSRN